MMLNRRRFLKHALRSSSLLTFGSVVPEFVVNTARAAEVGKERVLVVVELTGGNDGLNTVIPYADDLYHAARPKLRYAKNELVRVDDHLGLNPAMKNFGQLLQKGQLAIVQGVGYPNPNRSHFESMDVWQSADPRRRLGTGWIGRSAPELQGVGRNIPVIHLGPRELPLALQGAPGSVVSLGILRAHESHLVGPPQKGAAARRRLMEDLSRGDASPRRDNLLAFVQRRQLDTYATLDRLKEMFEPVDGHGGEEHILDEQLSPPRSLTPKLKVIARLIAKGLGTRVFYISLDGFDTHAGQREPHAALLGELADGIATFFDELQKRGHDKRVLVMTFSEFGRRVKENGSGGTDHGAASCLFVAGPAVRPGPVGLHPSLKDLDSGDLKYHTDFRRVYATLLDRWLSCDSQLVLGGKFGNLELLKSKA